MIRLTDDHRYIDDVTGREYAGVTRTIRDAGLMGWQSYDTYYMERGKAAHTACELWDKGMLEEDELDPEIKPYLDAWRAYRRDIGYWPRSFGEIEQLVYNAQVGYCGTMDRPGLDIKTGGPCAWHILQASAYYFVCEPRPKEWHTVYLSDDGRYKIHSYSISELREAYKVFCAALVVNQWRKGNG